MLNSLISKRWRSLNLGQVKVWASMCPAIVSPITQWSILWVISYTLKKVCTFDHLKAKPIQERQHKVEGFEAMWFDCGSVSRGAAAETVERGERGFKDHMNTAVLFCTFSLQSNFLSIISAIWNQHALVYSLYRIYMHWYLLSFLSLTPIISLSSTSPSLFEYLYVFWIWRIYLSHVLNLFFSPLPNPNLFLFKLLILLLANIDSLRITVALLDLKRVC